MTSAAFSPDSTWIVTASLDNTARIWDATTGEVLATLRGHSSNVRSAAFSPDGTQIVTASDDNTARIWEMPEILLVSPERQVEMACEHLQRINAPLNFTVADIPTYPILRGEPVLQDGKTIASPCAGILEGVE